MELTRINIFLAAKTELELVEMQLLNNYINQTRFAYQTPVWNGEKWFVWFFADVQDWKDPKELSGDELKIVKGEL